MNDFLHTLLDSSIRISLVAVGVYCILLLTRAGSCAVRHAAWATVLGAMLLMPILPYCVPAVPVPIQLPTRVAETISPPSEVPPLPIPSDSRPVSIPVHASTAPPAVVPDPPRGRTPLWRAAAMLAYALGLLALLIRMLIGWRSARRMARGGTLVQELSDDVSIYESALITVPLTIGVLAPRITLPPSWRQWTSQKLRAVLAHEMAHVQRRDSLVSLLAHLNRCVFWFHPLAWWLERKLATTAEHACDDAGIQAVGEPRQYAEILLDLADAVRSNGGRHSWQGIGIDGTGMLGQRIDRILRSNLISGVSRSRKAMVACGCAAVIILVAGCRQQRKVAALQENPEKVVKELALKLKQVFASIAANMTAEQADALEAGLKSNPDDLETHKKLLFFYSHTGPKILGVEKAIAARRPHVLWMIQHHPEDEITASREGQIAATPRDSLPDPEGYAQAKKLWLAQTESPTTGTLVLSRAAAFFRATDKPLAEKMLLRAQAIDPKGRWSAQLGRLYFEVLAVSNAHEAYADEIGKKLAASNDPELVAAAGDALVIGGGENGFIQIRALGMNGTRLDQAASYVEVRTIPLGKAYLERVLQLDPQSMIARRDLDLLRRRERDKPLWEAFRNKQESQFAASLPESERYRVLAQMAVHSYQLGDKADYGKVRSSLNPKEEPPNHAAAKAYWEQAGKYAQESLRLAPKFINNPDYGTTIYRANVVLGMQAMRIGNRKAAVGYMLNASKAPRTEELAYGKPIQEFTFELPAWLLKDGERESVIEFLERFAQVNVAQKSYLLESAALIRNGKKPLWY